MSNPIQQHEFTDSSNVVSAMFCQATDTEGTRLYVTFKKAGAYRYDGVPERTFKDFISAESPGRFMHANIINRYPVMKVNA